MKLKDAEKQKKSSTKKEYGNKRFVEDYTLPTRYKKADIKLISRSPYSVYAYWEIDPALIRNIQKKLGVKIQDANYSLRMHETETKNFDGQHANSSFDITLTQKENKKYIDLPRDNANYCADIGFKTKDGDFHLIARSNVVTAQRNSSSNNKEFAWMDVNKDDPKDFNIVPDHSSPYLKDYRKDDLSYDKAGYEKFNVVDAKKSPFSMYGNKVPLNIEDILAYYAKLSPLLQSARIKKKLLKENQKKEKTAKDKKSAAPKSIPDKVFLEDVFIKGKRGKKFAVGASEELVETTIGASEQKSEYEKTGASEKNISSKERSFFFELNTELIVYGRTEPNATVTHGDKVVPLREDGTFTMRFALPDATNIPLDFKAVAFDKEQFRIINTSAGRTKTVYGP